MSTEVSPHADLNFDRGFLTSVIRSDSRLSDMVAYLNNRPAGMDPAHDMDHSVRVAIWSVRCNEGKSDIVDLIAAAYLHDFVWVPKDSALRNQASSLSAVAAEEVLNRFLFSEDSKRLIQDAILNHSFSRGLVPQFDLGKAVQDADRLECLGAIGIARHFSVGAQMNANFFDPEDPWSSKRELNDKKYSLDHYFTKIFRLEKMMNTPVGKAEAKRRTDFMRSYLSHLSEESLFDQPSLT